MPANEPSILVIEDDPGIRDTVSECLEFEGYSVALAANGAEGLEYLRRSAAPKLIVLDLVMPVMNGSEFIEQMRREPALAKIPVVLMTAAGPSPVAVMQANDHLYKPFDLSTLLDTVARYCGAPRAASRAADKAT